jgi:hypothetical protein
MKGQKMKRHTCNKGGNPSGGLETREHITVYLCRSSTYRIVTSMHHTVGPHYVVHNVTGNICCTKRNDIKCRTWKLHPGARNAGLPSTF